MTKKILFVVLLYTVNNQAFGQNTKDADIKKATDSIKMGYLEEAGKRYPILRQAAISTEILSNTDVRSELNGGKFYEGKLRVRRTRANFSLPLAKWGKNSVSGSVNYLQQQFELSKGTSYLAQLPVYDQKVNKSVIGFSASFVRADSLFNRPVFYSASIAGYTDELNAIHRITYSGSISFPFKRTATTSLTLGLVAIIDPSSPVPAAPFVSYWHKFSESGLELFIDMPSRLLVRKQLSQKSWVNLGTELNNSFAFFNFKSSILPENAMYSTLELKSGPSFEYLASKKLILGISGGVISTLSSRLFRRDDKPSDYFIKNKMGAAPYLNFSVSFLPFGKH